MVNPLKSYVQLKDALQALDFDVVLPKRYKIKQIYTIAGKILEIRYNNITVRKAKYSPNYENDIGVSGVYTGGYPSDCNMAPFSQFKGQEGKEYWNGSAKAPKKYLAIWTVEEKGRKKYAYSVYAPKGIKFKTMDKWECDFR